MTFSSLVARGLLFSTALFAIGGCATGEDPPPTVITRVSDPCNGEDDDGNGMIDESFDCAAGSTGECEGTGTRTCTPACEWGACNTACSPGAEVPCGNCGTRTCGPDGGWGGCEGEGVCEAGASRMCAEGSEQCLSSCQWGECLNDSCFPGERRECGNCGARTCSAEGTWGGCADEGPCVPGETDACGLGGTETCQATCQWGDCEGAGECTPGEERGCGNCGMQSCGDDFRWIACAGEGECEAGSTGECGLGGTRSCDAECRFGACMGEGACANGDTLPCGFCGTQTCADNAWGECEGVGPCAPGSTTSCGLGGMQTCGMDCDWTPCSGEGDCVPGTDETCGRCGLRFCRADYTWSACAGEGECLADGTEACGLGGTRTCSAACMWGGCEGEGGECMPDETRECGNCGTQTCDGGGRWGDCAGSGCEPGSTRACGIGGVEVCSATCMFSGCSEQTHALSFDGNDQVTIPQDPAVMDFSTGPFTIEAWIRADADQPRNAAIFGNRRDIGSGQRRGLMFGITTSTSTSPGTLFLLINNSIDYTDGDDLRDGAWHHVAVTRNGGNYRFYVDGVQVSLERATTGDIDGGDLYIGQEPFFPVYGFRGDIHNVRLWNVERSGTQLLNDSEPSGPMDTTGLRTNWKFDEGTGQTASDVTSGRTGELGSSASSDDRDPTWITL